MKVATVGVLAFALTQVSVAQSTIYRCVGEGGLVYADRPCAADADPHEIDDSRVTVYAAPPTQHASGAAPTKPSRSKKAGAAAAKAEGQRQAKCAKLDQGLRDVRTKMRTGYGVEEGERLKARQRQLTEQRRTQKCR